MAELDNKVNSRWPSRRLASSTWSVRTAISSRANRR